MALFQTLRDDYNDNSIAAVWTTGADAGVTVQETSQQIQVAISGVSGYGTFISVAGYDLTASYAKAQLVDAGNQALQLDVLPVYLINGAGTDGLWWNISANTLFAQYMIGGVITDVSSSTSYVTASHKHFRIREAGGTIFWDYAADDLKYTNYGSLAKATFTPGITNLEGGHQAGIWGAAGTTTLKFDNFNVDTNHSWDSASNLLLPSSHAKRGIVSY